MSADYDELDALDDELKNIQNVIHLTRENIDALNAKFADLQHPPPMYLTEYQELTSKLHELEVKEQRLSEQLNAARSFDVGDAEAAYYDNRSRRPSVVPQPRNPVVRAHLPNQQRTSVQVKPRQTVRDALAKAMKLRNLTPEMCVVNAVGDDDIRIPWDAELYNFDVDEIRVKILDKFPVTTSISHNFVRKTFFSLAFCECCRRLLFQVSLRNYQNCSSR